MNRRAFLKLFAAAGPVAAVAPTYFFAPVGGWKSDLLVHPRDPLSFESVQAAQQFWYTHPSQAKVLEELGFRHKIYGGSRATAMDLVREQRLFLITHGGYTTFSRAS